MNTSAWKPDHRIRTVSFDADNLIVALLDGRTISAPLAWYPRLQEASQPQLAAWEIIGAGHGIHWPQLDEDLSIEGLLAGYPAPARRSPPENTEA
ncbi:DUF2442 domain-containing protein [Oxalobacteraceae bacterium A2-2]